MYFTDFTDFTDHRSHVFHNSHITRHTSHIPQGPQVHPSAARLQQAPPHYYHHPHTQCQGEEPAIRRGTKMSHMTHQQLPGSYQTPQLLLLSVAVAGLRQGCRLLRRGRRRLCRGAGKEGRGRGVAGARGRRSFWQVSAGRWLLASSSEGLPSAWMPFVFRFTGAAGKWCFGGCRGEGWRMK